MCTQPHAAHCCPPLTNDGFLCFYVRVCLQQQQPGLARIDGQLESEEIAPVFSSLGVEIRGGLVLPSAAQ